jgi:hypothetical protein
MNTIRLIAVLFLVLVLGGTLAGDVSAGGSQGPRIYIGEGRFDFGTVAAGSQPAHIFEIKNVGNEVLELRKVQPT